MEDNVSMSETSSKASGSVPCRFFKWGTCKFGNRCRFNHVQSNRDQRPEREVKTNDQTMATASSSSQGSTSSTSSTSSSSTSRAWREKEGSRSNKRRGEEIDGKERKNCKPDEWVNAPEFVPATGLGDSGKGEESEPSTRNPPASYAKAVSNTGTTENPASMPLCPYAEASGVCKRLDCPYFHGDICELCGRAALHPFNKELSQKHTNACIKQHEADMELSFAIQRSRDKACGVCFEIVMEKSSREQRFGILPNCNHCFCLSCIRKWRQAKQFDNKIIRSCPECRVASDFVCPSTYWVDTKEEKEKLIVEYKSALSQKDCKYFNKGQGKCPFGNKCFYMHALPDGTKTDVGPPARQASNGEVDLDFLQQLLLWNFLEERENGWIYVDDHDEVVVLFSDSEDSDWSRLGPYD
ncbi:probable E3 ubiquitin-protein ligase makorin-1 isoform X2 [Diachasma alloeum]|nr:probable E3 ubiquitin-protein ligase makorin-1 isoform X2 [Diachasma alloeum]XP_015111845.1 probable E3 ubiquitin-protein ligase makorin-1 isoform X2 [Diachasma alloeum]